MKHFLNSIAYCTCREVKLLWFPLCPYILNRNLQECAELHFLWADRDKIGKNSWKTSLYFHLSVNMYSADLSMAITKSCQTTFPWRCLTYTFFHSGLHTVVHTQFFFFNSMISCVMYFDGVCILNSNLYTSLITQDFVFYFGPFCVNRKDYVWWGTFETFAVLVQPFNPTAYVEKQTVPSDTQQNTFFNIFPT